MTCVTIFIDFSDFSAFKIKRSQDKAGRYNCLANNHCRKYS